MNKGEKIEVVQNLIDELRQMPKKDKEKLNDFIYISWKVLSEEYLKTQNQWNII